MTIREFFNSILILIGATSLTDEEALTLSGSPGYTQANYDQFAAVLATRDGMSGTQDRLIAYFKARGLDVTPKPAGASNIFIGAVL